MAIRHFVMINQSSEMDVVAYHQFQVFGLLSYSFVHDFPLFFSYHDGLARLEFSVSRFDMGSMVSRLFGPA